MDLKITEKQRKFIEVLCDIAKGDLQNCADCYAAPFIRELRELSIMVREGKKSTGKGQSNIPDVRLSLPSKEDIREPIQSALYATGHFLTDECTEIADGILTYLNDYGFKVVRQ